MTTTLIEPLLENEEEFLKMNVQGNIPEEIAIVSSVEQPVYRHWEDIDLDDDSPKEGHREMVIPAFVVDNKNPKTLQTAIRWAEDHRSWYDPDLKKNVKKADPVIKDVRKNIPMTGLRVINLDIRGQGGRAYKISTPEKYYFDMREDVLLDTMTSVGIGPGGVLNGEYIWARVASSMKLVRVDSALHKALVDSTKKRNTKKISAKDILPGNVYSDARGEKSLFVGWIETTNFSIKKDSKWSYYNATMSLITGKETPVKKAMLWYNLHSYEKKSPLKQLVGPDPYKSYNLKIKTSHTFIEHCEEIVLPKNIITTLRDQELVKIRKEITINNTHYRQKKDTLEYYYYELLSSRAGVCCMSEHGSGNALPKEYADWSAVIASKK